MANFKEDVVTALYDYNSQDKEELSIYKNEQLELLDASCAWWKVIFFLNISSILKQ